MDRYTEMTVSELRSLAKERGIKLPVGSVKQTIIDLLSEADKASAYIRSRPSSATTRKRMTPLPITAGPHRQPRLFPGRRSPARAPCPASPARPRLSTWRAAAHGTIPGRIRRRAPTPARAAGLPPRRADTSPRKKRLLKLPARGRLPRREVTFQAGT